MEQPSGSIFRSILAVAGISLVFVMLISVIGKLLLNSYPNSLPQGSGGDLPTPFWITVYLLYPGILAYAGGYLTASIAGYRGVRHALAFGLVVGFVTVLASVARPNQQPLWYTIGYSCVTILAATLGGMTREERARSKAASQSIQ